MADGHVRIDVLADTGAAEKKADELKRKFDAVGEDDGKGSGKLDALKSGAERVASDVGKAAAAGAAAAGTALAAITTKATQAYSEYEQLTGGVEKLFGDAASRVEGYAQRAYVTAGLSTNAYMTQVTGLASALKQSFGGDAVKAADAANTAIIDMSDNANIFGSNIQDIQNAYAGFAKQNYTMLDNLKLGYGGTKQEMQRLIDDANAYERAQGRAGDLTIEKFGDVVQAIHDVQEQQGIAGDTAAEAADTVQGSLSMVQGAWENWLTALGSGDGVEQATQALIDSVGTLGKNLVPVVSRAFTGAIEVLPDVLSSAASTLGPAAEDMGKVVAGQLADAINGTLSSLGIHLPPISGDDVLSSVQGIVDGIAKALQSLSGGFSSVTGSESFREDVQALSDALGPFYESVLVPLGDFLSGPLAYALGYIAGTLLQGVIEGATTVMQVLTWLSQAIQSLHDTAGTACSGIQDAWDPLVSGVQSGAAGLASIFTDVIPGAIQSVVDLVTTGLPGALDSLGGMLEGLPETVMGAISQLPGMLGEAVGLVIGIVVGLVASLGELAVQGGQAFLGGVSSFFSQLPGAVSGFLSSAVAAVASWASSVVASGQSAGSSFLSGVGSFFSQLPGTIGGFLSSAVASVASFAAQMPARAAAAGQGFMSGIQGGFNAAVSFVRGIPGRLLGALGDLGGLLVSSGRSMMSGLARGIQEGINAAKSAVSGGLASIRKLFPFSPAKEGPFSGHGYTTWSGRALMRDFADSIAANASVAADAARDALAGVQASFAPPSLAVSPQVAYAPSAPRFAVSVVSAGDNGVQGALGRVEGLLSGILDGQGRAGVYIDGRQLVGAISDRMDQSLGARRDRVGRGF